MPKITQSASSISEEKSLESGGHHSPLEELLGASKDAERLISCFFDLHAIEGEPFQGIWDRLATAIHNAQHALHPRRLELHDSDDASVLSRRPV